MQPLKKKIQQPEKKIRNEIVRFLMYRGWHVEIVDFNGLPDLYATHKLYFGRWIEVKLPEMKGSSFTVAQKRVFPAFSDNGTPIWVLTDATEYEYQKLFKPSNFFEYFILKGF